MHLTHLGILFFLFPLSRVKQILCTNLSLWHAAGEIQNGHRCWTDHPGWPTNLTKAVTLPADLSQIPASLSLLEDAIVKNPTATELRKMGTYLASTGSCYLTLWFPLCHLLTFQREHSSNQCLLSCMRIFTVLYSATGQQKTLQEFHKC